ncbi:MAG: hypothetical protein J6I80_02125 [Clostridia bacterium]|nr:hypothetical protein [Clostridia bacterium]
MKKAVALLLSLIMLLFCGIPALALEYKDYNVSFELPQEYVEINAKNASDYEEVLKYMGHTKSSFKKHLEKNNILLFAILKDNSRHIQLKVNKTEFSEQTQDISLLKNEALNEIGKKIIGSTASSWNMVDVGGVIYYEITANGQTDAETCSVQYTTIKNGNVYTLVLYGDKQTADSAFAQEAISLVSKLDISSQKEKITASDADTVMEIILIFALILLAAAVAVIIIISFVRDAKNKRDDSDFGDMTIQRRRYK